MHLEKYLMAVGDLVLPRVCLVCGERLNLEERHICLGCLADMPLTRYWERKHNPMADRFNERIQKRIEEEAAREGGAGHERYAFAAALFFYHSDAGYRHIPYQIKYMGNFAAGRYFGRMLGRRLEAAGGRGAENRDVWEDVAGQWAEEEGQREEEAGPWADVDMVMPVPLHWMRRWKRGYNQAEVIAGAVAEAMGICMRNDVLIRRRRTKTQVKLNVEEKARNVSGAFAVSEEARAEIAGLGPERQGGIENGSCNLKSVRHILLVDDVFTTGSTLEACHGALREIFPPSVRISAVTLGYLER